MFFYLDICEKKWENVIDSLNKNCLSRSLFYYVRVVNPTNGMFIARKIENQTSGDFSSQSPLLSTKFHILNQFFKENYHENNINTKNRI